MESEIGQLFELKEIICITLPCFNNIMFLNQTQTFYWKDWHSWKFQRPKRKFTAVTLWREK